MRKNLIALACMADEPGAAGGADTAIAAPAPASTKVKVQMDDGRTVEFGEKTKILKDYSFNTATGLVSARIDFADGKVIEVLVDPNSEIGHTACGHGLVQKLGDSAAGAESLKDAYESILEIASRINGKPASGDKPAVAPSWTKDREGGGSAKGSSELLEAVMVVAGLEIQAARDVLATLTAAEKTALRRTPEVAAEIEKIRAAKPKAEGAQAKKGAELLGKILGGGGGSATAAAPVAETPAVDAPVVGGKKAKNKPE